MHDFFQNNKVECFNLWLDSNKNWDSVLLSVERSHSLKNEASKGWITVQGKELRKTHEGDKADKIMAIRKASGMWFASQDFPDDDEESSSG